MIVYQHNKREFINECNSKAIASIVSENMRTKGISYFDKSQIDAWKHSLPAIANVLEKSDTDDDIDVAIEYKFNQSKDRIDFLIYGKDENDKDNVVIIELKQWSSVSPTNKPFFVHTFGGGGEKDYWHPSYQAINYANILYNFNEYLQKNSTPLSSCSYLHNMDNGNAVLLDDTALYPEVKKAPVFLKDDEQKLADFIAKYVKHKNKNLLYEIEKSRIVPSNHLANMLADAIQGNDFFSYDEAQANAVSEIVKTVEDALYYNEKKTIIIKGGAGTGKSVVAINALGQLISGKYGSKRNAAYFTTNAAPRYLYTEELVQNDYKKNAIKNLFKYPTVLLRASENEFDCSIIDEAHRVFDFKGGVGMKKNEHVLESIIRASRVCVFFIDEDQMVTKNDYATIDRIRETARKCHSRVIEGKELELQTQFRVLGGEQYMSFVKSFLGYNNDNLRYRSNNNYEFKVFDSAAEMLEKIKEKDSEFKTNSNPSEGQLFNTREVSGKCRLVAGYTYNWVTKLKQRCDDEYDIILDNGNFKAKWNLRNSDVGSDYSWLNDPQSINEVGCIHTCQGLDMNYCGVIIGKDLTYNGRTICFNKDKNAKTDNASGIRNADDELAKTLIRNTYNVLLTRGMKGTYVYCEDQALANYLKTLIIEE